MKWKRYLVYIIFLLITIPSVVMIFKIVEPKNKASIFAGGLFILSSLLVIITEALYLRNKAIKTVSFWSALFFLVLFSAPMVTVRILNYQTSFNDLTIYGIQAQNFHKYSNYGFILFVVCCSYDFIKNVFYSKIN